VYWSTCLRRQPVPSPARSAPAANAASLMQMLPLASLLNVKFDAIACQRQIDAISFIFERHNYQRTTHARAHVSTPHPVQACHDYSIGLHRNRFRLCVRGRVLNEQEAQLSQRDRATHYPTCIWRVATPFNVTQLKFRRYLRRQNTRFPGLSYGVVFVILCLTVLVQCRLVSEGQTDGRTDGQTYDDRRHHIPR